MGGVMVPVELTSTWIPLSILAMLCAYMIILFRNERAEGRAYEAELAAGGGSLAMNASTGAGHAIEVTHAEPATTHVQEAPNPVTPAAAIPASTKAKRKQSLTWRTAHLWLPFVAGFGGQAYLDFLKTMIEKVAH